ncbi:MAG: transposase [Elusimicrobia bacterium]|nr:transposase [Elusimicrobiota bacterium]
MFACGAPHKTFHHSAGVSFPATPGYRASDPRGAILNRIVTDNLPEFKLWMRDHQPDRRPRPHPAVITAMEKFTECGDMRFGAVRFRCPDCGRDMFVAFSCKRRGLCPSCDAKRASIITTDASDRLLPPVPYRQWVLVVPKRLRWYLNQRSDLPGELSRVFAKEISRFLRGKASGTPIQLHFVQRFGGELNLHIHIHAVVSDGVFNPGEDGKLCYTPVCGPTETELAAITEAVRRKVIRRLRRIGGLCAEAAEQMLSWKNSGFSIHEEVRIEANDKQGREHLLYYCARPALSQARLVYSAKSKTVIYRTDARGGRSELLTMSSLEFLRRWGLLMPPPNKNLVRYYGALAPHSPLRGKVVAKAADAAVKARRREKLEKTVEGAKKKARSWAACLARVFEVFPLICPKCQKELLPVAVIFNDHELIRILKHFGLPTDFPRFLPVPTEIACSFAESPLLPPAGRFF